MYRGRCRHRAGLLAVALLAGCASAAGEDVSAAEGTSDVAAQAAVEDRPSLQSRYYEAYLAEVVRGDIDTARAVYLEVMSAAGQKDPILAARAALRLAELESRAGSRGEALELVARATALGGRDPEVPGHRLMEGDQRIAGLVDLLLELVDQLVALGHALGVLVPALEKSADHARDHVLDLGPHAQHLLPDFLELVVDVAFHGCGSSLESIFLPGRTKRWGRGGGRPPDPPSGPETSGRASRAGRRSPDWT